MIPGNKDRLSRRVIRSGIWVFSLRITERILYIARLIILARILEPHDFGLLGIAMLTMMTLENFSQTGFEAALIQKKEKVAKFLDSAWTVGIIRGLCLFVILYLGAPWIAGFFNSMEATTVIRVVGLSFLIKAFTNVGLVYFKKELQFNRQFVFQLSGTLADFAVAITMAILLKSVWALVFGLIAGNTVRLFISYFVHPYRPQISLDFQKIKILFGFGKWVMGSSVLVFFATQGDDAFVGKFLGLTMLGYYQMAYRISNTPTTEITQVISQVSFPALSKLQGTLPRLRNAYLKILQLTAFLSFPTASFIVVMAADFTQIFLGDKWLPMVPAMLILAFAGLLRAVAASSGFLFYALGKPEQDTRFQIVRLTVLAVCIYPLTVNWGIAGTSLAVLLSILIACIGFSFMAVKLTECGLAIYTKMLVIPLVNSTISALLMWKLKTLIATGIFEFAIIVLIGGMAYLGLTYLSDRFFNYRMWILLKDNLQPTQGS